MILELKVGDPSCITLLCVYRPLSAQQGRVELVKMKVAFFFLQNLDLTKRKMVHEGPLLWKVNRDKTIGTNTHQLMNKVKESQQVLVATAELHAVCVPVRAVHHPPGGHPGSSAKTR